MSLKLNEFHDGQNSSQVLATTVDAVTGEHTLNVSSSGGGGGGDASAANQVTGNASLAAINTNTVNGLLSTVNSSTATLAISGVFTGTSEDITQYGYVNISVFSDVASATDGLSIQQSSNGTNWDINDVYTVPAATGKTFSVARAARFFRIVYTNGGTIQASFRLQTIFTKGNVKPSSVRPQDSRTNDNDMEEILSYNMSYDPLTNTWSRMQTQDLYVVGQSAQTAIVNNILTTTAGANATDVLAYRAFAIQVISTASGGTFIFEGSNDNVNFQAIPVFNQSLAIPIPITTAITATVSQIIYTGSVMFRYIRLRIATTITGGTAIIQAFSTFTQVPISVTQTVVAQGTAANLNATVAGTVAVSSITTAIVPGVAATNLGKAEDAAHTTADTGVAIWGVRQDAPPASPATSATGDYGFVALNRWNAVVMAGYEKNAKTFSASTTITSAVTATDIAILPGNATNTVYVTKVVVSGVQTTAGTGLIQLIKRSAANTGGTSAGITLVPHDSADTGVSVPLSYTANPTPGAAVGTIRAETIVVGNVTSVSSKAIWEFGDKGKQVILSGVAQGLAINLNGITFTGGSFSVYYEWIEI